MSISYQNANGVINPFTNLNDARELLTDLTARLADITPKGSQIEFRGFSDKEQGPARTHWLPVHGSASDINAAVQWCAGQSKEGRGVFMGYNPRKDASDGSKANVVETPMAFYVDLDIYKLDGVTQSDVLNRISELSVKPTYTVNSGGGIQLVWIAEPQKSTQEWKETQELLYNEFKDLGADRAIVTDTARVLRVPGFPNQKQEQPRPTSLVNGTPEDLRPVKSSLLRKAIAQRRGTTEEELIAAVVKPRLPLPDEIVESGTVEYEGRNALLYKHASALRDRGHSAREIEVLLKAMNEDRCKPPLPDEVVEGMAMRVAERYEPTQCVTEGVEVRTKLGLSGGEILNTQFELPDFVIHGLARGQVGQIVAKPNAGKTKLLRNLALSLAVGREYLHLTGGGEPYRVAYFDFEDPKAIACRDIQMMTRAESSSCAAFDDYERGLLDTNLMLFADEEIGEQPLTLSNPQHLAAVNASLDDFRPDLIIADTLATAFEYTNENDNSEMTQKVMKPMKALAKRYNCAVLIAHHSGKRGENGVVDNSRIYSGRGASAVAGFVRAIYDLEVVTDNGRKFVRLSAPKIKGRHLPDMPLRFDDTGKDRWFVHDSEVTPTMTEDAQYTEFLRTVSDAVARDREITRKDGIKLSKLADTTFDRYAERAVKERKLVKGKRGKETVFAAPMQDNPAES